MNRQSKFKKLEPQPAMQMSGPRLLKIKDAATYLGVHEWFVRTLIREGRIRYLKPGKAYMLDKIDLEHYIDQHKTGVAA